MGGEHMFLPLAGMFSTICSLNVLVKSVWWEVVRTFQVGVLTALLTGCVTLDKLRTLSLPPCSHLFYWDPDSNYMYYYNVLQKFKADQCD